MKAILDKCVALAKEFAVVCDVEYISDDEVKFTVVEISPIYINLKVLADGSITEVVFGNSSRYADFEDYAEAIRNMYAEGADSKIYVTKDKCLAMLQEVCGENFKLSLHKTSETTLLGTIDIWGGQMPMYLTFEENGKVFEYVDGFKQEFASYAAYEAEVRNAFGKQVV